MKKYEARVKEAKEAGKKYTAAAPPFKPALDRIVWGEIEKVIEGTETVRSDRRHARMPAEENEGKIWTATDLYRGIAPLGLSAAIKTAFETTKGIATHMADKFVEEIEEHGRVGIWKERCAITVEWEKSVGITTVSKVHRAALMLRSMKVAVGFSQTLFRDNGPRLT